EHAAPAGEIGRIAIAHREQEQPRPGEIALAEVGHVPAEPPGDDVWGFAWRAAHLRRAPVGEGRHDIAELADECGPSAGDLLDPGAVHGAFLPGELEAAMRCFASIVCRPRAAVEEENAMLSKGNGRPAVYIAGPMVFYPDAAETFREMKAILAAHGL